MDIVEIPSGLCINFLHKGLMYQVKLNSGEAHLHFKKNKPILDEIILSGYTYSVYNANRYEPTEENPELYQAFMENLESRIIG